jgi:putative DNA primase/helicase
MTRLGTLGHEWAAPWRAAQATGEAAPADLESGTLRDHERADRITKLVPVDCDANAACSRWLAFLEEVLPDPEVRAFLQRAVSYPLTGLTDEQVLFLLYGTSANGKSTFLEIIREIVGDYGCQTPAETLLAKRDTGIPNDVARLMGRRFMYAVESEEGQPLAEARIKALTGGDTISARFMRAEWFEFRPQLKLWMGTIHKPRVRGDDHAIWRRIRLVPFTETIPESKRDPRLLDKLRQELPGILCWTLEGCRLWQQHGLAAPQAVQHATAAYRDEEDIFGDFLDDEFEITSAGWVSVKAIGRAYETWCQRVGQRPFGAKAFNSKLRDRGFEEDENGGVRGWVGLTLKANDALRSTSTDDDDSLGVPGA